MAKSIREAMTSNPRGIEASTPVAEAAQLMKSEDVGSVPVLEGERLVGMLTDRDIVVRVLAEGRDPQSTNVGDVASRELVTVDPQQDLDEALRLMAQHQVRRLPVVEEDERLVGILAQADVALEGGDRDTGQLVEQISEPGGGMAARRTGTGSRTGGTSRSGGGTRGGGTTRRSTGGTTRRSTSTSRSGGTTRRSTGGTTRRSTGGTTRRSTSGTSRSGTSRSGSSSAKTRAAKTLGRAGGRAAARSPKSPIGRRSSGGGSTRRSGGSR